jgi:hypothetical protein
MNKENQVPEIFNRSHCSNCSKKTHPTKNKLEICAICKSEDFQNANFSFEEGSKRALQSSNPFITKKQARSYIELGGFQAIKLDIFGNNRNSRVTFSCYTLLSNEASLELTKPQNR